MLRLRLDVECYTKACLEEVASGRSHFAAYVDDLIARGNTAAICSGVMSTLHRSEETLSYRFW
jgi:hypothetical protein